MKTIVGVFDNDQDAEAALSTLDQRGFGRDHVEMVASNAFDGTDTAPGGVSADVDDVERDSERDHGDGRGLPLAGVPGIVPGNVGGVSGGTTGSAPGAGAMGFVPVPLGRLDDLTGRLIDLGVDRDDAEFYAQAARKNGNNAILIVVKAEKERVDEVIDVMRAANGVTPRRR